MANRSYVSFLCEQDLDTLERWLDHALDERDAIIESGACDEELAEYHESKSMEELADLLEVIRAVAAARGSSIEEVEAIRRDKAEKRGGFEKRILLTEVIVE